jgi:hypothetical protein
VAAAKPSADIEVQMKLLLDEALAAFDASAKALLPSGVRWTYAYERASVAETMEETARAHVQTLQVQGLYLSKANAKLPIDLAAHWLLPHPFGRDSRYDPVRPNLSSTLSPAPPTRTPPLPPVHGEDGRARQRWHGVPMDASPSVRSLAHARRLGGHMARR